MNVSVNMVLKLSLLVALFCCHCFVVFSANDESKKTGLTVIKDEKYDDATVQDDFSKQTDEEDFVPTREWKTVKPGQAIPKGLHVRLNLQTGLKEAKLLDDNNGKSVKQVESKQPDVTVDDGRLRKMKEAMVDAMKELEDDGERQAVDQQDLKYWKEDDKHGIVNMGKDHFTQSELKEALKKFKANKDDVQDEKVKMASANQKYRDIDELKKDFKDLNMDVKTDLEILRDLHEQYRDEQISEDEKLRLLEDLEYYVHQIDNGVNFVDIGTLQLVLKDLNHTSEAVRQEAAFVIGSAVQSNPKVKIQAMESGAMHLLIRLLSHETSVKGQGRVIYALSSLVRNFPYAQLKFLEQGGFQALGDVFTRSDSERLQVKIVTLLGDLVHEHNSINERKQQNAEELQEAVRQYERIPLLQFVTEHGWCDMTTSLLALPGHDQREKTLSAMKELLPVCQPQYSKVQFQLQQLYTEYSSLARDERQEGTEDVYFSTLEQTVGEILQQIQLKQEL